MENIANQLYYLDKQIFMDLRALLGNTFLENNSAIIGDPWAWMPFFVFMGVLLIMNKPNSAVFTVFFGLAAFVLSLQASMLLSFYFQQYAPWVVEAWLHNYELPAMGTHVQYSLPDWPIAACFSVYWYARLHLRSWGSNQGRFAILIVLALAVIRVYAGYSYPIGVVMAIFVGALMAWVMFKVAQNVEYIALKQASEIDK